MAFHSILFKNGEDSAKAQAAEAPAYFGDLNLDQVVASILEGKEEYRLAPFFYASLRDVDAITYRHEVMRDIENAAVFDRVTSFARDFQAMRERLAQAEKLFYVYQKEAWFLDAVSIYCEAVESLQEALFGVELASRGMRDFRDYLAAYTASERFVSLREETRSVRSGLAGIRYCVLVKGSTVKVRKYDEESDYSAEVERTFEKFKQGAVKDYRVEFQSWAQMNHVEERVLDMVAQLFPESFSSLDRYCAENRGYLDETVGVFDRELQFYVAYLSHIAVFKRVGLGFSYPTVDSESKEVYDYDAFDIALARKLVALESPIVCNDFFLKGEERIFVVSGPNQGGKTTFARTFGQLHHLASIGCPVPGREARLFLFDNIFTHFEKEEDISNLRGKLQDDLVRMHGILGEATPKSIVIMNEIFNSTTLQDAVFLAGKVIERIIRLDLLCVCVTFLVELASASRKTVSVISTIVPDNPAVRTYKVVRSPANGLSYALSIAEKYRLTYDQLKERIKS